MAVNSDYVLITGASSGIGRDLAKLYAKAGSNLILMARRQTELEELAREIKSFSPDCDVRVVLSDAGQPDQHHADVRRACEGISHLSVAIANAGISRNTDERTNTWIPSRDILTVNVLGAIATLEAAKDVMLKQGYGQLVGVSSVAAIRGMSVSSAYCASKSALSSYLEAMRIDLHTSGISVTSIHPGFVATPMTEKNGAMPFLLSSEQAAQKIFTAIRKKRARFIFPWPMAVIYRLMHLAPDFFYDFVAKKIRSKAEVFKKNRE